MSAAKAWIHAIATAVPPHEVTEETVRSHAEAWLGPDPAMHAAVGDLIRAIRVERRRFAFTPEELLANHGLQWMNREYSARILPLAEDATRRALDAAGMTPRDVDLIVTTSCTGFTIPALDAHLANRLSMRQDLRRLPITELGCSAGAAGLGYAADHLRAHPDHTVLLLTAELTSATFQVKDLSKSNLVASLLFGDGVAATVISGRAPKRPSPRIVGSRSAWFPDTTGLMGFDLSHAGFHLVLSPKIPAVVKREVAPFVGQLLADHGRRREDLSFFVLHPGGRKVLEGLEQTLEVPREATHASWEVLRTRGNLSSAMVIFVLDEMWRTREPKPGSLGVLAAFGPAFGAEASLLEWAAPE